MGTIGLVPFFWVFDNWIVDRMLVKRASEEELENFFVRVYFTEIELEGLILAQNERWRRA